MIRKRNLRSRVLRRNSNKRLYESIMKDVAKKVKNHLNENEEDYEYNYFCFDNFLAADLLNQLLSGYLSGEIEIEHDEQREDFIVIAQEMIDELENNMD